jgi:hypothetical protein
MTLISEHLDFKMIRGHSMSDSACRRLLSFFDSKRVSPMCRVADEHSNSKVPSNCLPRQAWMTNA